MHDSNNIASTSDSSKLPYRKDIQGLRALSILLVIAAHAKIPGLKGGFIGVDVFFVISGYLITGLLIQELTKNSQINLLRFYARRLKRLLPALALVVTVTALLASRLLTPMEQPHQAISAAAAIFWVSNILFVLQDLNYFDGQAEQNIYLHTWSLGVEEQFYLVWPILLTIVFWATKGRRGLRTALISAFAIIGALSLIACIWQTSQDARLAFYLTPFRAWQFCAGSIAFLLRQRFVLIERRIIDFASIVGIILIIGSAILLSQSIPYPGILSVIPTAGAALVLISGSENKRTVVDNILQSRLAQGIGNISYSWYLWHWPVLGIGYLFLSPQKLTNSILLILIAWILAVATYFLIENPIRQNKKLINFNGWQIVGSLTLMALINISAINWFNQMDQQIKASPSDFYADAKNDMPIIYRMGCDDWYQSADVKLCSFGDQRAANTAAIIGDSIGLQWFPALHKIYGKPDWKIVVATKSACPMVDEDFYYQRIGRTYTECSKWRNALMATLKQIKPNVIIFGSAETYDFTADQWTHGTGRVLRQISQSTDKAYVIRATPGLPFDGPQCLAALKIRAAEKDQRHQLFRHQSAFSKQRMGVY
ncbi:MAG: acyltransferase [Cellvibrionaceae bacterium]|nr:acyltransferase [Cellvibrionaceae bacterium]